MLTMQKEIISTNGCTWTRETYISRVNVYLLKNQSCQTWLYATFTWVLYQLCHTSYQNPILHHKWRFEEKIKWICRNNCILICWNSCILIQCTTYCKHSMDYRMAKLDSVVMCKRKGKTEACTRKIWPVQRIISAFLASYRRICPVRPLLYKHGKSGSCKPWPLQQWYSLRAYLLQVNNNQVVKTLE